jgi:hypothetical protein
MQHTPRLSRIKKDAKVLSRNTEAHAHLIDAAPDLLVALEEITRCAKMQGPAGTTAYLISQSRMGAALAAIAKAYGKVE